MVTVRKKKIGNKEYYYLGHTTKICGKVEKREKYLGVEIPKNIEQIKAEFFNEIFGGEYFGQLNRIKKNFSREYRLMPKVAKEKYLKNFIVKFTYNTNRIEGSTLTLRETANLLEEGITPKNKPVKDVKEAEAHSKVFFEMLGYEKDLNLRIVLRWHKLLFENTEPEIAGGVRRHRVTISGSMVELPLPVELDFLLRDFFRWYNKARKKSHPVELAALVHLKFVSIHPFSDGNGRISRLMMNFVLQRKGYPMLDIAYKNRNGYYTALERSQLKKMDYIFVRYILKRYLKEYRMYL